MIRKKLPFVIFRNSHLSFIDQVTDGLRNAILNEYYLPGDVLPNLAQMATALKVSDIVIRRAVKRLVQEGLLHPRRGKGIMICGKNTKTWRGTILYVHWSNPGMYYHAMFANSIMNRLYDANWLMRTIHVDGAESAAGFPKVTFDLSNTIAMAIIEGYLTAGMESVLIERRIPFVTIGPQTSQKAKGHILFSPQAVLPQIKEHCRACGIKSAVLFASAFGSAAVSLDLNQAGLKSETVYLPPEQNLGSPASVEQGALLGMKKWLQAHHSRPDLFFFVDDFLARGALLAMLAAGIRVPEDVQVISWANKGLGPVYLVPLTRIEMDPVAHGEAVAGSIIDFLDGRNNFIKQELSPQFIVGETTKVSMR